VKIYHKLEQYEEIMCELNLAGRLELEWKKLQLKSEYKWKVLVLPLHKTNKTRLSLCFFFLTRKKLKSKQACALYNCTAYSYSFLF
jgi:hypothetical protein